MIRDIKNDILPAMVGAGPKGPRSTEREPKPDAKGLGERKSFADQLMDAHAERVEKGGRDDTPKLASKRIKGKDPDDSPKLRSSTDAKRKMKKEQKADVDDTENLRSQSGAGSEGRMNLKEDSPENVDSAQTVKESGTDRKGLAKGEPSGDRFRADAPKASQSEGPARIVSVRSPAEAGPVDDAEMVQILEQLSQDQSGVKQQAMTQFMARMQNEFGIEPEKILEAFGKMDAQSLLAPPEETMKQFLNNLELKPEQIEKAQELYQDMVQVTGEAELNEKLAIVGAAEIEGVNLEILSPQERALKQLNEGIDQLNSAFFKGGQGMGPQGAMSAEKMDAEVARLARMKNTKNEKAGVEAGLLAPAAATSSFGSAAVSAGSSSALDSSAGAVASLSGPGENFSLPGMGGDSLSMMGAENASAGFNGLNGEAAQGDAEGSSGGGAGSSAGQGSGNQLASTNSAQKEMADALKATDAGKSASKKSGALSEKSLGEVSSTGVGNAAPFATPTPSGMPGTVGASAGPSAMIIEGPKPTPQDEAENIRELIKQAQFMVKKGGGEMKLQMSPEGMGQVHLKVAVENGQVNVQMLTDNDASKKLLEDGLHELKASLAAQKLHVESMKVNLGSEIQKHMDQQAQQDASREQARQFAQDFMGQFRDERQGFRQGFAESPAWKSYGRGPNRASVEPEKVTASSQSRSSKNADGSKRLNLVA